MPFVDASNGPKIINSQGLGVVLELGDQELADRFEDYLAETRFVFFKLQYLEGRVAFLFGEASSLERVSAIYREFTSTVDET